jgi:2-methylcitrate dehydratase PrpD
LLGPLNGQMWTFIHLAGAAAATSKLLGLDAERTTHALAIALAQPNFALAPGFLLPGSKLLAASTPTATGIQAAYFARAQMTGFPGIVEDHRGFWQRFSFLPLPSMLDGLGEVWITPTLAIKTYPGCHYFQTALSAIDRIRQRLGSLAREDVVSIDIATTQLACEATRFASEYVERGGLSPVSINFDLALSAAVLVHAGRLSPTELDPEWLAAHGNAVRELAARIRVVHDPELTAQVIACVAQMKSGRTALRSLRWQDALRLARRYRREYRSRLVSGGDAVKLARAAKRLLRGARARDAGDVLLPFPNRVTVELRGGRRETEQVDVPVGTFALAGSDAALAKKMEENLGARGPRALAMILDAETHSLEEIIAVSAQHEGGTKRTG